MQAKDIPEQPIIDFLAKLRDNPVENRAPWGTIFEGYDNSITNAMPPGTPNKVALAKMKVMIRKGSVSGCCCGCRGDFTIK